MKRWLTYLKERYPLPVYLLLSGGITLSASLVTAGRLESAANLFALAGLMLFFFELRLMDELKDYSKDQAAHPERPLPRGLLGPGEVRRTVNGVLAGMLAYAALGGLLLGPPSGLAYLAVTVWLFLMYREFFLGDWLGARPLLYAVTHQVIMVPLVVFAAACVAPRASLDGRVLFLSLANLGAFFAYEVCRKLDPRAHPVLKTYLSVYGVAGSFAVVAVANLVAAFGAWSVGMHPLLWPLEALVMLSFIPLFRAPRFHKLVEGTATISLLIHLWGPVLYAVPGWLK